MLKKRIYLSCEHKHIKKVMELLGEDSSIEIEGHDGPPRIAFDSQQADNIKHTLAEKIKRTDTTLCIIGNDTYKSPWIDWELNESEKQGKPIIAMALKGITKIYFPKHLDDKDSEVYEWDPGFLSAIINNTQKEIRKYNVA